MANLVVGFGDKAEKRTSSGRGKAGGSSTQVVPGGGVEGSMHSLQKESNKIDFGEFMVSSEQGQMISWESYLESAVRMAKVNPNLDRGVCEAAFQKARREIESKKAKTADEISAVKPF